MISPPYSIGSSTVSLLIGTSCTFKVPYTGFYRISALGAGASGGVGNGAGRRATGGGAGGFAEKTLRLTVGDDLVIVVGARGGQVSRNTNGETNGNAGGTTTVTGPGISLEATGGAAGQAATSDLAASAGGTGSGGDINFSGGASGTATGAAGASAASGGGAAGSPFGNGNNGGAVTATSTNRAASGGGCVFGAATAAASDAHGAGGVTYLTSMGTETTTILAFQSPLLTLRSSNGGTGHASDGGVGVGLNGGGGAAGSSGGNIAGGATQFGGGSGAGVNETGNAISGAGGLGIVIIEKVA